MTVSPPELKPGTVANAAPHLVQPGATAISQCVHNPNFSNNTFPGQRNVCCCRSSSSVAPVHFPNGNNSDASADTEAGFLPKQPLCCLFQNGSTSNGFSCTVTLCEDGGGKPVSEQDTDGIYT